MTQAQLDMFTDPADRVVLDEPVDDGVVSLKTKHREIRIPLKKKRREAIGKLLEVLADLEGKGVYVGTYDAGGRHFWIDNLKLERLQLEFHPMRLRSDTNWLPGVIVLWGRRGGHVRIFTDYLVALREQEYQGYWHWLLDFRTGLWEHNLDSWRSHYACLHLTKFKQ